VGGWRGQRVGGRSDSHGPRRGVAVGEEAGVDRARGVDAGVEAGGGAARWLETRRGGGDGA
jgi:hypothetical protein